MRQLIVCVAVIIAAGCKTTNDDFEGAGGAGGEAAGGGGGFAWPGGGAGGDVPGGSGGDVAGGRGGDVGGAGGDVGGSGGDLGGTGGDVGGSGGDLGGAGGDVPVPQCEEGSQSRVPCGLNGNGLQARVCRDGEWADDGGCLDADTCTEGTEESERCGEEGNGRRQRRCMDGLWSAWSACDDPDRPCEDGAIEQVPCGLNRRGLTAHHCVDGHFGPFGECVDPDICVDGGRDVTPCGLNDRGHRERACVEGAWTEWNACDDTDACVDEAAESEPCGLNAMGRRARTCSEGQWGAFAACADPDECANGTREADPVACGVEGNGERFRTCGDGRWGAYGACDDPDRMCADGERESEPCGVNGRGQQTRLCADGRWGPPGECRDDDLCVDGAEQSEPCGLNEDGRRSRRCVEGAWGAWAACQDPDVCVDGANNDQDCGLNGRGSRIRSCLDGQWTAFGACDDPDVCTDGRVENEACGEGGAGTHTRTCRVGRWPAWGECVVPNVRCDPAVDAHCQRCTDRLELNDRLDQAPSMQAGDHRDLTVCNDVDRVDYYRLDLLDPTVVMFSVLWTERPAARRVVLDLLDARGGVVQNALGGSFGENEGSVGASATVEPGRYYIRVTAAEVEVRYRLNFTLQAVPLCGDAPPTPACIDCADQFRDNQRREDAARIQPGRTYTDLEICSGDVEDWYHFEVPGPAHVRMEIRTLLGAGGIWMSNYDGADLWVNSGSGDGRSTWYEGETDVPLGIDLQVRAFQGATRYEITVTVTPIELPACGNGLDDDGDALVDADDWGCASAIDDSEIAPAVRPACANGMDDDADGRADYPLDPECAAAGHPDERGTCIEDVEVVTVAASGRYEVDTTGLPVLYGGSCGNARSGAVVFAVDLPAAGRVIANVVEADFDTVLSARAACDEVDAEIACNDDRGGGDLTSQLDLQLPAGRTFFILQGYSNRAGRATLELTLPPR